MLTWWKQTKSDEIHLLTQGQLHGKYNTGDEFIFVLLGSLLLSEGLDIAVAKPTSRVAIFVKPNRILQSLQNQHTVRRTGYNPDMQGSEPSNAVRFPGSSRLPIQYRLSGSTRSFRKAAAACLRWPRFLHAGFPPQCWSASSRSGLFAIRQSVKMTSNIKTLPNGMFSLPTPLRHARAAVCRASEAACGRRGLASSASTAPAPRCIQPATERKKGAAKPRQVARRREHKDPSASDRVTLIFVYPAAMPATRPKAPLTRIDRISAVWLLPSMV